MELSQNYVKLLSLSSLSKNTWQNDNLQSRYFNFCLTFTLGCCHYMPSCCHGILLQPGVSLQLLADASPLSPSDTGSSGVPAAKDTSKHTLSRRIY